MRIWNKITGEPWAITENSLQTILEVAARENEKPEAVAAKLGRELRNTHTVIERDGVAIIPVVGPLFRYANIFTQISGASSYEILAKDFTTALENPDIKAIILDIDSPGGEVNGVSELAGMVFDARGKKPIVAYASGDVASGAYWLASAADKIVVSSTSSVGSIGVVGVYRKKDAKESASEIEIVSSQSPHRRIDPSTDEGHKRLQSSIDAMADVFIATISRNRGISPEAVLDNYGGGDIFIGANAVNASMAESVGSLERIISELASADNNPPKTEGVFLNKTQNKESPMAKENITIESLKQEQPDLVASIARDANKSERERIKGIMNCAEAKGREDLAKSMAFDTDMDAILVQQMMATAPVLKVSNSTPLDLAMATMGNPDVGADMGEEEQQMGAVINRISKY